MTPGDLPFLARIHALPGGRPRPPAETARWLQATPESHDQLALGYLAVVRKEDGELIGRCA
jgi:RimJ/RimL family protein N-acetyltransferase